MSIKSLMQRMQEIEGRTITEGTKETGSGRIHRAEPGGYGRKLDTDDEGVEVKPEAPKRGRGRPRKGADSETGEVKDWDTETLQRWIVGSVPKNLPGKPGIKHKIKDESTFAESREGYTQLAPDEHGVDIAEELDVYRHKGTYGTEFDGDDGDDKKKKEPVVKRGRGRPRKDADITGHVPKWDTETLSRWIVGNKPKTLPGKPGVKHKLKDWMEYTERQIISESIVNEGRMGEISMVLQDIINGNTDLHDVLNHPRDNIEEFVSKHILEPLAEKHGLDPIKDFDQLQPLVMDELGAAFGEKISEVTLDPSQVAAPQIKAPGATTPASTGQQPTGQQPASGSAKPGMGMAVIDFKDPDDPLKAAMQQSVQQKDVVVMATESKQINEGSDNNAERLQSILRNYPMEHRMALEGWGVHESLYQALCDHYWDAGKIPRDKMTRGGQELRDWVEECYSSDTAEPVMENPLLAVVARGMAAGVGAAAANKFLGDDVTMEEMDDTTTTMEYSMSESKKGVAEAAKWRADDKEGKTWRSPDWDDGDLSPSKIKIDRSGKDVDDYGDELTSRPGAWRGKTDMAKRMTKKGVPTKSELGFQDNLKMRMRMKKKEGGLTGPKGHLPEEGVAEGLDPDTQRLEQEVRDALANGDDYTAKSLVKMAQTAADRNYLRKIIRQEMYGTGPGQGGVAEGSDNYNINSEQMSKRYAEVALEKNPNFTVKDKDEILKIAYKYAKEHAPGFVNQIWKPEAVLKAYFYMQNRNKPQGELNPDVKLKVNKQMLKVYGPGKVTFTYHNYHNYVQHEDKFGDTNSNEFDPKTGKVKFDGGSVSSTYYGEGVAEGANAPYWRVEQSEATGRYYVVTGYTDKSRKVWKNKLGAADFNKKENAEAKANELNQGVAEGRVDEKLTKSMTAGEIISDFVGSKDPKFKGISKKKRTNMALGAYYGMHPEKSKKKADESKDAQMESWSKELNALLNEGLTITTSTGNEHSPDSVSVNATDADAHELMKLVQSAGLGKKQSASMSTPGAEVDSMAVEPVSQDEVMGTLEPEDDGVEAFGFLKRMLGARGEHGGHSHGDYEQECGEECGECGHTDCQCDHEEVDEMHNQAASSGDANMSALPEELHGGQKKLDLNKSGSLDAEDFKMLRAKRGMDEEALDKPATMEGDDWADAGEQDLAAAKEESANEVSAAETEKEIAVSEGEETCNECGGEMYEGHECGAVEGPGATGEKYGLESLITNEDRELTEWANSPDGKSTDEAFLADLTFMTKTISGGLNNIKQDQTVLPGTRVKTDTERASGGTSMAEMLRKLANIN